MTNETKIIAIIGTAALLAAFVVFYTPFLGMLYGSSAPKNTAQPIPMQSKNVTAEAEGKNREIVHIRDPFYLDYRFEKLQTTMEARQTATTESAPKKTYLVLNGIFMNSDGNIAIIDDRMYSRGQSVYGWTILGVYSDRVVLNKRGQTKVIRLKVGVE